LYKVFETADYVLNIPQLKGHQRAGVTMFAKNHLGSQLPDADGNAGYLHMGLVRPYGVENPDTSTLRRFDYGMYRSQVDFMMHKLLSGKNLIYIMDALWGTDWELDVPLKWKMQPFNNQYSSSIFVSLDPVAIESVGYDFLRSEFTVESGKDPSVQMPGVDDYLHQAADSNNWPVGIKYDPNNTGVHVYSLGTHEHWNNATERKYSRNLDPVNGTGIELIETEQTVTSVAERENGPEYFRIYPNYPNPFNPSTTIAYSLPERSSIVITIYDIQGRQIKSYTFNAQSAGYQRVVWNGTNNFGNIVSSGIYLYRVTASSLKDGSRLSKSAKMMFLK
ncbi:MAG: FlgD immunoglobulin-like domain containing protein, partial [Bacteroidota bacterium]